MLKNFTTKEADISLIEQLDGLASRRRDLRADDEKKEAAKATDEINDKPVTLNRSGGPWSGHGGCHLGSQR